MAELKVSKLVASLPSTLEAGTIYLVKSGAGFDMYVTNQVGDVVAYALNAPASATGVFSGVINSAATSITLSAAHHGQILVLSANTLVVVSVPASGLPGNFYCRVLSTTAGGFRTSASSGVTVGSPMQGYLAVRAPYADADIYAIGNQTYVMKSGYLSPAFTMNGIPGRPLIAVSSSRRISQDYTGNLIEVRRTADDTLRGIGTSGDALDTAVLAAFVGSGSGYVSTLYDQSGNGRHLTQTTASKQPRIVAGGTLDQAGGHAAVRALAAGSGTYLDVPLPVTGAALTMIVVGTLTAQASSFGRLVSIGVSGQNDWNDQRYSALLSRQETSANIRTERGDGYTNTAITYGTPFSYVVSWNGTQASVWVNNVKLPTRDVSSSFDASTLRVFASMQLSGENWDGSLCELMLFGSALTDAQIGTVYADQKAYYSLP